MTPDEFVEALRQVVLRGSASEVVAILDKPPGRKPDEALVEASRWYKRLSAEDRQRLAQVLALASRMVLFGTLAVLDGVRPIGERGEKGEFRLTFRKGGQEWELVGERTPRLHELL